MTILETVIPVFLMIFLGKFLKSKNIISDSGISCIKSISTNVFLPVMAFDTLIHGSFSLDSLLLIGLEIFILFTAFGLGFLFKRFFDPSINGYVPYAMTTYEGGLFGWALIAILVGHKSEAMFSIVSMDIFSGIFCFTVMATGLKFLAGQQMTKKEIFISIITNPLIIAVILGFIGAAFNLGEIIDNSKAANLYTKTVNMFIQPLSPMILICIGSGLVFDWNVLKKGLKLAFLRYGIQIILCLITLLVISITVGLSPELRVALLVYFFVPTSFLLSMYANDKEAIEFTSGYLSLQIIISLIIYSAISIYASYYL
ncbi:MAG: hypothetical protein K6D95_08460 [Treponema sp.]|jgi:predicted permease|nr:hypothetical protein [Treponema sp.]